ncbi:MAG: hypothetical protein RSF40_04815 [Oscillospiraceae bacterium]
MKYFVVIVCLALAVTLGWCSAQQQEGSTEETKRTQIDTIYINNATPDTVYITRTVNKYLPKIVRDTVTKEIVRYDTVEVQVPISKNVFLEDSLYRAEVSGYQVTLDRMEVYQKTVYRTENKIETITNKKRWGIGVQVGYGIQLSESPKFVPYVGVGVSYSIIRF